MSELSDRLAAIADAAFNHDSGFERFGPSNFWMRFLVFLNDLSLYLLRRSIPGGRRAREAITILLRLYRELAIARPDVLAFLEESAIELADIDTLCPQPMPWSDESVPAQAMHIPNMLEPEAMRYYTWLGRTLLYLAGTNVGARWRNRRARLLDGREHSMSVQRAAAEFPAPQAPRVRWIHLARLDVAICDENGSASAISRRRLLR